MSIDFRNPLTNQGALLARLRGLVSRAGSRFDTDTSAERVTDGRHTDRVSLSSDSQRLANGMLNQASVNQYDAERVSTLKQAIESGSFRIDTARIAEKVSLQYGDR